MKDVAHINGAVLANRNVMPPINLSVIGARAAPACHDIPRKIYLQELFLALGKIFARLVAYAAIDNVNVAIDAGRDAPGLRHGKLLCIPDFDQLSIGTEDLDTSIFTIGDIDAILRVNGNPVRRAELAGGTALFAP